MREQFDQVVELLSGGPNVASLVVSDAHETLSHYFRDDEPTNVRSIAKPIVCLALGIAIDRGLRIGSTTVTLDSPVWPLIKSFAPTLNSREIEHWSEVRLIDLLRITFGQETGIMFSKDLAGRDPATFLSYILEFPARGLVGKDFVYSNAGTYLLSAIITEGIGTGLDDFVQDELLSKLDIEKPRWDRYGDYVAGCTGLWVRNEELHKVGQLLNSGGVYRGARVASAKFIEMMRSPQVAPPTHRYVQSRTFPKWSYGLNLWICEDGTYYCDGTDGQYLIVIPENERVITVLAHEPDSVLISDALKLFK
jgi:CubicO group peptidase (beta-lactamase class C family)